MSQKISVPDLGDFHDVEIIDVLVKPGDKIDVDTPLLTIETEKATMDVPSTSAGIVKSVAVQKGGRVSKGSVILEIEDTAGGPGPEAGDQKAAVAAPESRAPAASSPPASSPQSAAVPSGAASSITVPDLGDFHDVEVIDVLVKVGDRIEVDTPLLTLETEKATMDVPSTGAGTVKAIAVKKGDRVSKGSKILEVESLGAAPAAAAPAATPPVSAPAKAPPAPAAAPATAPAQSAPRAAAPAVINEAGFAKAHASPSVRRFARELGVDLSKVTGSGLKGRITADDVKGWVKRTLGSGVAAGGGGTLPKVPEVDFSKFGAIDVRPLGRIQKISGPRLQASWLNVPHVWQMDEADITELEATRKKLKDKAEKEGIKLTPLAFILRACVKALQEFPVVNSSLDPNGQNLVWKKYLHLGFAADTPNGLVVPVIRDADRKDIYEIARDLATLSAKARDGKLSAAEMQGACFTVSSLGGIGGTSFTPIINSPEVAILGVARSAMKPVYQDGQFVPRLILPFTFAYDHRVIDGALGARFTTFLSNALADVKGLLEAVP
ncbi:MAG TPA: dihydrolipoyllysine-residue acetyltransferase [Povalibacter sp.]|nr:dihydrolipoyllysine-residue acetyltransferase [Povalibacter sp.]